MGLSPLLVQEIFDIIQNVHKEGMTILLVEQNAKMALSIADRAYVLETGNVDFGNYTTVYVRTKFHVWMHHLFFFYCYGNKFADIFFLHIKGNIVIIEPCQKKQLFHQIFHII